MLSLDMPSQRVAEEALGDKRGARSSRSTRRTATCIALVSRPGFDPNLFGRGLTRAEFAALNENIDKPLLNRALRGTYPPGSTVKPAMALAGLVYNEVESATRIGSAAASTACPAAAACSAKAARAARLGRPARRHREVLRRVLLRARQHARRGSHRRVPRAVRIRPASPASTSAARSPGSCRHVNGRRKLFKRPADQIWFPGRDGQLRHRPGLLARDAAAARALHHDPRERRHVVQAAARQRRSRLRPPARSATSRQSRVDESQDRHRARRWHIVMKAWSATLAARHSRGHRRQEHDLHHRRQDRHRAGLHASARTKAWTTRRRCSDRLRDHSWFIAFAPAEAPRIAVAVHRRERRLRLAGAAPIARKVMDTYLLDANGQAQGTDGAGHPARDTAPCRACYRRRSRRRSERSPPSSRKRPRHRS